MNVTTTYDEVKTTARQVGTCPGCDGRVTRTRTFIATVSPFNRVPVDPDRPEGDTRPATRAEVRRQVDATAAAWAPEDEVFRHDRCHPAAAENRAPAAPTPVPADRWRRDRDVRGAVTELLDECTRLGIPAPLFTINQPLGSRAPELSMTADPGEFLLWARALGVRSVRVDASRPHAVVLSIRRDATHGMWRIHATVWRPPVGDRLGGTPVTYGQAATGKRSSYGSAYLDDLAAGLARMQHPEWTRTPDHDHTPHDTTARTAGDTP